MKRNWVDTLGSCVNAWDKNFVVTSPDIDGLLTAAIVGDVFRSKLIGIYNTRRLLMFDGFRVEDSKNALWLDHDIDHSSIQSVGQHLLSGSECDVLPKRNKFSFNPNEFFGQDFNNSFRGIGGTKRDKYPFATAHLFTEILELYDLSVSEQALMLHADGALGNMFKYKVNCQIWLDLMFPDVGWMLDGYRGVENSSDDLKVVLYQIVDELEKAGIKKQSSATIRTELPEHLKKISGRQSVPTGSNFRNETILDRLNAVIGVLNRHTRFNLEFFVNINDMTDGEFKREYPQNKYQPGELCKFILDRKIFSHAFVSNTGIQFTTFDNRYLRE